MDTSSRFSSRVPFYHTYRPRYPHAMIDVLAAHGLTPQAVVADIGTGTGISSELINDFGCTVYAVEPNAEMRDACAVFYSDRPNFHIIDGTAEATTFPDSSLDWVVAGQAFHWFNHDPAKAEFVRILRPDSRVALFWNDRADRQSAFVDAYNQVMRMYDVEKGSTPRAKELIAEASRIEAFFAPYGFERVTLENPVTYDLDGLLGRAVSSSYAPLPDQPAYAPMADALREVFAQHAVDGRVQMDYVTQVYVGRVK